MFHWIYCDGMTLKRSDVHFVAKKRTKLKHTNSIPEYFEYSCQMSSKSILIILSYTVSKLVHFLRHSVLCTRKDCPKRPNSKHWACRSAKAMVWWQGGANAYPKF